MTIQRVFTFTIFVKEQITDNDALSSFHDILQ